MKSSSFACFLNLMALGREWVSTVMNFQDLELAILPLLLYFSVSYWTPHTHLENEKAVWKEKRVSFAAKSQTFEIKKDIILQTNYCILILQSD